jgi:hypothetical protein
LKGSRSWSFVARRIGRIGFGAVLIAIDKLVERARRELTMAALPRAILRPPKS